MKKVFILILFLISNLAFPKYAAAASCTVTATNTLVERNTFVTIDYGPAFAHQIIKWSLHGPGTYHQSDKFTLDANGQKLDLPITVGKKEGNYTIKVWSGSSSLNIDCQDDFIVGTRDNPPPDSDSGDTMPATSPTPCVINGDDGIYTALGCIPTDTAPFVNYILARAVSIGGGIAFLIMLFGAFTLITSAGNPENVQKGKDILTSALTGLLFIIFAIFLLKFIGVDILQLPEFKETKITIPKYKRR